LILSNVPTAVASTEAARPAGRPRAKSAFYLPALDGIRAIAFLLVFFSHAELLGNFIPGGLGVTIFFFLSGYLITTLLRAEAENTGTISLKKFYVRRARRILPPMYLTLALAYFLGHIGILSSRGSWRALSAAVFYYYNYFEFFTHGPNLPTGTPVVWSLMIEEHFYLLFPLIFLILASKNLTRRAQTTILVVTCAAALLWRLFLVSTLHLPSTPFHPWTYSATDARFDSILWGCVLAIANNPWYREDRESSFLEKFKGTWALVGFLVLLGSLLWRDPFFRETVRYSVQSMALYPIFYYCGSARTGFVAKVLEFKPLMTIGHLSYSMYLIHLLILQTLIDHFLIGKSKIICLALVLTFAYGLIMRSLVENPLRKLIH
jgi:peptidoglycan/LPS O-acetylase OafA/YrhL